MARGWESKEVESQQEQAESDRSASRKRLTPEELERNARVHLIQLDIARIEHELSLTTHPRRVVQLQKALAFLMEKMRQVEHSS